MLSFKDYLTEDLSGVKTLTSKEISSFNRVLARYKYEIKTSSRTKTTVIVRAPDEERKQLKTEIENKLSRAGLKFQSLRTGGSTGSTSISFSNHTVLVTYKPSSGGMSETTLNSTITELVPALAFMSGKKIARSPKDLYNHISKIKGNPGGVYLDKKDMEAGQKFIQGMPSSSKFEEKMMNAIAILKYLKDLNSQKSIANIYWGYRKKPDGVSSKHKGDLFIKFTTGEMLGVSLKAGGAKTKEPQLNTYVNKFFTDMGLESDKNDLIDKVYNSVHSTLNLPKDWDSRGKKTTSIDKIEKYKEKNLEKYEKKYDKMLDIIRNSIISAVNSSKEKTIEYIHKQILKKDDVVPLVIIKAYDDNYQQITDEDQLDTFLPLVKTIKAYKSMSSKQAWFIDLSSKDKVLTMNMTIRSNKPMPENKIAQGYNLAIKFNGISHGK